MTIKEIFETMDYGTAPESSADALAWLADQGSRFGHYIDGAMTTPGEGFESRNPASGEVLAARSAPSPGTAPWRSHFLFISCKIYGRRNDPSERH